MGPERNTYNSKRMAESCGTNVSPSREKAQSCYMDGNEVKYSSVEP